VPVERHRRHIETLGYLAHADASETALVRERDRGLQDGIAVEP